MKRLFITGLLAVLTLSIFAQSTTTSNETVKLKIRKKVDRPTDKYWYMTLSGGYGIPFLATNKRSPLKEVGDKQWYQHGNDLSVKSKFGTNGGGFAFNVG